MLPVGRAIAYRATSSLAKPAGLRFGRVQRAHASHSLFHALAIPDPTTPLLFTATLDISSGGKQQVFPEGQKNTRAYSALWSDDFRRPFKAFVRSCRLPNGQDSHDDFSMQKVLLAISASRDLSRAQVQFQKQPLWRIH